MFLKNLTIGVDSKVYILLLMYKINTHNLNEKIGLRR